MKKINPMKSKKGFTLVELIVVMAILAVLVLLAAPKLLGYSEKARTTQIRNDIKVLETKIDEYLINHESFPDTFIDGVVGEGQLYDRKGKIEAAPSDLKVVDRTFYPETELPGTFYTDPDGDIVYENKNNDSNNNEEQTPVACVDIDYSALEETPAEYFTFDKDTQTITDYSYEGPKSVVIPSKIEGVPVLRIGEYAFSGYDLTGLILSNNIIEIEEGAFDSNEIDGEIRTPCSMKIIGDEAFAYNSNIDSVVLNEGLIEIGYFAFGGNEITGKLIIPESVTSIGDGAFSENQINEVQLPRSMTSIPAAFSDNLFSKEHVQNLLNNTQFTSIDDGIYGAFSGMYVDKIDWEPSIVGELVIPENIKRIGNSAFSYNGINKLVLHEDINYIGDNAFTKNYISGELNFTNSLKYIGKKAFYINQIDSVTIPESILSISERAFESNKIEQLTLKNGINSIERFAFSNNRINQITIPNSINSIGDEAFSFNDYLNSRTYSSITFKGIEISQKLNIYGDIVNEFAEIQTLYNGVQLGRNIFDSNFHLLPLGYEWATDADFKWNTTLQYAGETHNGNQGHFEYIGTKKLVAIPSIIHGTKITSYNYMFMHKEVDGVFAQNPSVIRASHMFQYGIGETLDLRYLHTRNIPNLQYMFEYSDYRFINLASLQVKVSPLSMESMFRDSNVETVDLSNLTVPYTYYINNMFQLSKITTVYTRTTSDKTRLSTSSNKPITTVIMVKPE